MAWVVDRVGPLGLSYGKFLLSLFVIGILVWVNYRQKVGLVASSITILLVATNLGYHWSFRPQLSSFVFYTLMIWVLHVCFSDWRNRWHLRMLAVKDQAIQQSWMQGRLLWLLLPIIFLWTNSHGGFVAGVCIATAYLGLRAFEAVQQQGAAGFGLARRMLLVIAGVIAVTLLNPYTYELPAWLLSALSVPRPEIVDWSNNQIFSLVGVKFLLLVAIVVFALVKSEKQRDFVHLCLLAVTLWQSCSHFRHVPFFVILCGFWLGPHLQSALDRIQSAENQVDLLAKPKHAAVVFAMLALITAAVSFQLSNRLNRIQVDRGVYPVDAFAYLDEHDVHGRVVVTFNWAQFAIAALCDDSTAGQPVSQVAFDGRFRTCYPQGIIDMHFDFLYGEQDQIARYRSPNSPRIQPGRVLEHRQPDLAVIRRFDEVTSPYMHTRDDWCLLYQDGLAEVWGRKSRFDNPENENYLPIEKRVKTPRMPRGIVSWPAIANYENRNLTKAPSTSAELTSEMGVSYVSN